MPAPSTPRPNTSLPFCAPRNGVSASLISPIVVRLAFGSFAPIVAAARDQDGRHDELREDGADRGIDPRGAEVFRA